MFQRFLAACALIIVTTSALVAQATGRLTGSVTDASGSAIPGAAVSLYLSGGSAAILTTETTAEGLFTFGAVNPGSYDLAVERSGFSKHITRGVSVDPSRETPVGQIRMEVASVQQSVEVVADAQGVQTINTEVSTTINQQQVTNLPVLDRQVSNLFLTQPGVTLGRGNTVINGLRVSAANVTYEGINIQDNFIRTNSLSYIPSKFTIEQVSELTIVTSNANASIGGGAAQVVQVAPSGSNTFHGNVYWYNRNNHFAANDWFNNKNGVSRAFLNQNQLGASLGGHIIKDKLLFYFNYEAFRNRQQQPQLRTILTPTARQGIFRWNNQSINLLNARSISIDPYIQSTILAKMPAVGNSSDTGDGLNTTGYSFNQRANEDRNAYTLKIDYNLSRRHSITGSYVYNTDKVDRPDLDNTFNTIPAVFNDIPNRLVSLAWRWTIAPTLTNELRGGFLRSSAPFAVSEPYPKFLLPDASAINIPVTMIVNNPLNTFLAQGRDTNTYNVQDNANWAKGGHNIFFGFQTQWVHTAPFNDAGILPLYTLGVSASNPTGFDSKELPGISSSDLNTANSLYTLLGGIVGENRQTFNITSRTSGYVPGATSLRHFSYGTYSGYVQDNWKVRPRLTLNLGMRYDYYARVNESDSLTLLPLLSNGSSFINTLLSNPTLDFAGNSVGRPYYKKDLNNFAPNAGFAWDVFGNGKTAVRGGYTISYINDDLVTSVRANAIQALGLSTGASDLNVNARLTAPPLLPTPVFQVPRTAADNYKLSPSSAIAMPDPNLRTPYVQQWSFGIERELKGAVVSVRYLGNHGTKLLRDIDYNQVNINAYGFLDDFKRARNNAFLSQNSGKAFTPVYNPDIPGSQPLTVFPQLPNGGNLTNATVIRNIRQGEVGQLAAFYQTSRINGNLSFFPNPNALQALSVGNISNSTYNALQFDVRKRTRYGVSVQFNYSFSKAMGDGAGDDQRRLEPLLDNNNLKLEHSREPYDLTHVLKGNYFIELPFGAGKRFASGPVVNRIIGGWAISGVGTYHSGTPFSILSTRGTFNRAAGPPVAQNPASTNLTKGQLDNVVGFFMTGNGPQFISPSVIGPDGRGVASDGATFPGQVFFNPDPGTIGNLQPRYFSGPWDLQFDASVLKTFQITEKHSLQFRMEAFNVLNHPAFYVGNESSSTTRFNVNSSTFGKIIALANIINSSMRVVQFGLYYRF